MTSTRPTAQRQEPWTVLRVLRWTTGYLKEKGADTARLDTEILLADALGLSRVDLYLNYDRPLGSDELAAFRERVRRRAAREPVAYITGTKAFDELVLGVGPEVLIPRPETEILVEEALRVIAERWPGDERVRLADLGTGSGAVALALASRLGPRARVLAVDISEQAIRRARSNMLALNLQDRVLCLRGNLGAGLAERRLQVITANLPYIRRRDLPDLAPEIRRYEPSIALDGGEDGLDIIRRAITEGRRLLAPGGVLLLELDPRQRYEAERFGLERGYARAWCVPDLAGLDRVVGLDSPEEGGERHGQDNH